MSDPEADLYYSRTSCPALLDALYNHMAEHPEEAPVYLRVLSEAIAMNTARNVRRVEAATEELRNLIFVATAKRSRGSMLDRMPLWHLAQIAAVLAPSGPTSSNLSGADRSFWQEVVVRVTPHKAQLKKSLGNHSRLPGILRWLDEHF